MATTKTLRPTNVTISIPEFTDQPDQRVNSNCIDKEADAINTLSEQLAALLKWRTFTINTSESFDPGASKSYTVDVSESGYTPIGVIQEYGSGTGNFAFQDYYLQANSLKIYLRNVADTSKTLNNVSVVVLYVKNGFIT